MKRRREVGAQGATDPIVELATIVSEVNRELISLTGEVEMLKNQVSELKAARS